MFFSKNVKINVTNNDMIPLRGSSYAAGLDLHADIEEPITLDSIQSGNYEYYTAMISTGVKIILPKGHVGLVAPRSGLSVKHGITIVNSPGIIDEDYRGTIHVNLINLSNKQFIINRGDRIAQLIITPISFYNPLALSNEQWENELIKNNTERGENGFGSTGM